MKQDALVTRHRTTQVSARWPACHLHGRVGIAVALLALFSVRAFPQSAGVATPMQVTPGAERLTLLEKRIDQLQRELNEVRGLLAQEEDRSGGVSAVAENARPASTETALPATSGSDGAVAGGTSSGATAAMPGTAGGTSDSVSPAGGASSRPPASAMVLPNGSTLNVMVDTYVGYNINQPVGRVNYLHAYDVLDDVYGLNQAAVMYELLPDLDARRRYGLRLDLQFGLATATLQGSSANEARPDIYRNIFQAYGRYVVPVGKGITVDVGKWASSLGYEGNYSKDQMQYSRAFFFNFLPFYHAGLRANYAVNSKLAVNYWMVNGTNQTEPTNSFKDELFGFVYTPTKNISWTSNYYLGQENPDSTPGTGCPIPTQPGLCAAPLNPAPDGRTHIFDNYVSWQTTPKLLLVAEGDYFVSRVWRTAGPGRSSAPSHLDGGAAYAQWQFNAKSSLAARGEYMSDRNGLFTTTSQALKEGTMAYKYNFADGFVGFLEYRRDWSNQDYFLSGPNDSRLKHQDIFTLGMVWVYGGKQGAW